MAKTVGQLARSNWLCIWPKPQGSWRALIGCYGMAKTTKGRTLLLTTHYMDEADALGDRIGIMDHGNVTV